MICSCTARFHYTCLVQYTRSHPEYNPFLNNRIKCVTCNGLAAGIERIIRNRHDDDDSNADLSNDDTCALYLQAIRSDADRGYADIDGQCRCPHDYHYDCLMAMRNANERNRMNMRCAQCKRQIFGILDLERQNRYLSDEDEEICPICQDRLGRQLELGKMRCKCTARFLYRCLHQYRNQRSSYDPDWNNGMKCVTYNVIAAGINRI
jgi:hypothetical protein